MTFRLIFLSQYEMHQTSAFISTKNFGKKHGNAGKIKIMKTKKGIP